MSVRQSTRRVRTSERPRGNTLDSASSASQAPARLSDLLAESQIDGLARFESLRVHFESAVFTTRVGMDRTLGQRVLLHEIARSAFNNPQDYAMAFSTLHAKGREQHKGVNPIIDLGLDDSDNVLVIEALPNGKALSALLDSRDKSRHQRFLSEVLPALRDLANLVQHEHEAFQHGALTSAHVWLTSHGVVLSGMHLLASLPKSAWQKMAVGDNASPTLFAPELVSGELSSATDRYGVARIVYTTFDTYQRLEPQGGAARSELMQCIDTYLKAESKERPTTLEKLVTALNEYASAQSNDGVDPAEPAQHDAQTQELKLPEVMTLAKTSMNDSVPPVAGRTSDRPTQVVAMGEVDEQLAKTPNPTDHPLPEPKVVSEADAAPDTLGHVIDVAPRSSRPDTVVAKTIADEQKASVEVPVSVEPVDEATGVFEADHDQARTQVRATPSARPQGFSVLSRDDEKVTQVRAYPSPSSRPLSLPPSNTLPTWTSQHEPFAASGMGYGDPTSLALGQLDTMAIPRHSVRVSFRNWPAILIVLSAIALGLMFILLGLWIRETKRHELDERRLHERQERLLRKLNQTP